MGVGRGCSPAAPRAPSSSGGNAPPVPAVRGGRTGAPSARPTRSSGTAAVPGGGARGSGYGPRGAVVRGKSPRPAQRASRCHLGAGGGPPGALGGSRNMKRVRTEGARMAGARDAAGERGRHRPGGGAFLPSPDPTPTSPAVPGCPRPVERVGAPATPRPPASRLLSTSGLWGGGQQASPAPGVAGSR